MPATTNVAVHTISFRGKAGIIFALLAGSLTLFVVGFSTVGWAINYNKSATNFTNGVEKEGLWETCLCIPSHSYDGLYAVKALLSIGLIGLLIALLLITIYLCVHTVSKNSTIIALVCVCFISFTFVLIAIVIYGIEKSKHGRDMVWNLYWSFAVTVISSVFCFAAGVISIIQMRKSGVRM